MTNLAGFQAVLFVHNFGLERLLEATESIATVSAAIWQLFQFIAAASTSSLAKRSESSIILYYYI